MTTNSRWSALALPRQAALADAHGRSGLSYRELETRITQDTGVKFTRPLLHRVITQGRPTSLDRAEALAQVLGANVGDLFTHANGDPIGGAS